ADTLGDALRCVRPGGAVVVLGVFTAPPLLPATTLLVKEVRMIGSMMYDRRPPQADFATGLELLAAEPELASGLVTHQLPLDAVQQAFETAAGRHAGAIKVSVAP
ncbi:MAG: zinc-binding dehydrogenase, partial [Myxococcota bacterium]